MCGLVGFLGGPGNQAEGEALLRRMAGTLSHRGPDDAGVWLDAAQGIGFGHRRLAIVDLSAAGHQPMASPTGRYVLAFNGEIYNHLALREELEAAGRAPAWRGHSDTESLLAGFDAWGIRATVERTIGMFAIGVWDRERRTLTLARDRLGEKPLYFGRFGSGNQAVLMFGSELKALRAHPAFRAEVDRDALSSYLRHMAVPGPSSIYRGVHKLQPGTLLTLGRDDPIPEAETYWSAIDVAERGVASPLRVGPEEAVDALSALLKDAIGRQMMADVPLGAFLSGGIDSTTIVSLMQAQASRPVKTFTIGFDEEGHNEAEHAKAIAAHLGTEHTELYVDAAQAQAVIPLLPTIYDEPFADSSQIPTYLVSRLAKQHVTVSLSGDAGDELFGGYTRYQFTAGLWKNLSRIPEPLRRMTSRGVTQLSSSRLDALANWLPGKARWSHPGDKLLKGAALLPSRSLAELYLGMVSCWKNPGDIVLGAGDARTLLNGPELPLKGLGDVERMMVLDTLTYLPDDILAKVDRAAMAVSLESRVPFLDHRVVEFAWSLPLDYKIRRDHGELVSKWALRQVLYRHVPRALIDRPKMGFGVPVGEWLRGPLKEWAEELLSESRLRREGFFDPAPIRRQWAEHLSGHRNWQHSLWCVLMFQAWHEHQSASASPSYPLAA